MCFWATPIGTGWKANIYVGYLQGPPAHSHTELAEFAGEFVRKFAPKAGDILWHTADALADLSSKPEGLLKMPRQTETLGDGRNLVLVIRHKCR
jgi:hypothetical protein